MADLWESRHEAAIRSGGVSSTPIYRMVVSAAVQFKPDASSVLDFGTGRGRFIATLRQVYPEARICGADIMERPKDLPDDVDWLRGDLNVGLPVGDAQFDLISAVEVIEHLENPRHVMRELFRMLRPGGIAILSTPNTHSIRSLLTFAARGHHAQFDDSNYPAHITQLSEVDFERAGAEAGFQRRAFIYSGSGTIPKFLHSFWQALSIIGGHLKGRRFSDNFGVVLHKPELREG